MSWTMRNHHSSLDAPAKNVGAATEKVALNLLGSERGEPPVALSDRDCSCLGRHLGGPQATRP